jgi:hypothetical protein
MAKVLTRTHTANEPIVKQWNKARSAHWVTPPNGSSVLEIQTTHDPSVFKDVPPEKNYLIPPFHWHWTQEEYFTLKSGRFFFNYEGKITPYTSSQGRIVSNEPL